MLSLQYNDDYIDGIQQGPFEIKAVSFWNVNMIPTCRQTHYIWHCPKLKNCSTQKRLMKIQINICLYNRSSAVFWIFKHFSSQGLTFECNRNGKHLFQISLMEFFKMFKCMYIHVKNTAYFYSIQDFDYTLIMHSYFFCLGKISIQRHFIVWFMGPFLVSKIL